MSWRMQRHEKGVRLMIPQVAAQGVESAVIYDRLVY